MMQHSLSIEARFRPEVVERILRVVRHRGFELCMLNMTPRREAESINIRLIVTSKRSVDLLSAQLRKLMDVACIEIQQLTSQQICANAKYQVKEKKHDSEKSGFHLVQR
ncbi:MAG: Acetolactate synthase isozyme 2 small subunit [Sodalis sp. Psp]|nr:Acetolactate synthase isozyme 2 small subunit [Sodalis sp. Psp]MCR3756825.1 Acetolactate synthase isozyme 2 small subunit [Sodalis sp. Ppy]